MSDFEREGRDLWRRYRAAGLPGGDPEPDVGLLAAYAEGRLDEGAAEPVEAWLARDPARLAVLGPVPDDLPAPLAVIRNARALVRPAPVVVARHQAWRQAVAWASVAASLAIVGASGFIAGHQADDYHEAITVAAGGDLVYGPGGGEGDGAAF